MSFLALDHVQLAMPRGGEDAARAFYEGVLGMREVPKPGPMRASGGAWFGAGAVEIHLGVEDDFRPARKAHPGLRMRDVDALAARCADAGLAVTWDDRYPGMRRFYVDDPFGNRIEVMEPTGAAAGEDGGDWTDLLEEPRAVTSVFGGVPSLRDFALMELVLGGSALVLRGDLARMPDPLPERWAGRGYTRAGVTLNASAVLEAQVTGAPRVLFDERTCLLGAPVDLSVERAERSWTAPDGTELPCVVLSGASAFVSFRFVCTHLRADVTGYHPAPY